MSDEGEFRFEGTDEMKRALEELGPVASELLTGALAEGAEHLLEYAQTAVPVRSGELSASGFSASAPPRKEGAAATLGYTAEYAAAVHEGIHGGKHQQAAPPPRWLEKAVDAHADEILAEIGKQVEEWIGD